MDDAGPALLAADVGVVDERLVAVGRRRAAPAAAHHVAVEDVVVQAHARHQQSEADDLPIPKDSFRFCLFFFLFFLQTRHSWFMAGQRT